MKLPPFDVFRRWVTQGRVAVPKGSRSANCGVTRRLLLANSLAALAVAQASPATAQRKVWFRTKPPVVQGIPVARPAAAWAGDETPYASLQPQDTSTVFGSGWGQMPVVNFSVAPYAPIEGATGAEPNSDVVMVTVSHADVSGAWMQSVEVRAGLGAWISLDPSRMQLHPDHKTIGYPFRPQQDPNDLQTKKTGNLTLEARVRPVNGREKVFARTFLLDTYRQRPKYYVDIANGTDDMSHGGAPGTSAWKTFPYAELKAPEGSIVEMAAGDYREDGNYYASGTQFGNQLATYVDTNKKIVTFRAAAGLSATNKDVQIGLSNKGGIRGTFFFKTNRIQVEGIYHDQTWQATTANTIVTVGAPRGVVWWKNCQRIDDEGPCGVISDPSNGGIVDPDRNLSASPIVKGGFGFWDGGTVSSVAPIKVFTASNGTWFGAIDTTSIVSSLTGSQGCMYFERGHYAEAGYDMVFLGGGNSWARKNAAGAAVNDYADYACINTTHVCPAKTAYKQRQHDKPTVRIASITSFGTGAQTMSWSRNITSGGVTTLTPQQYPGTVATPAYLDASVGFAKITFDNQMDTSTPTFASIKAAGESMMRFVTGALTSKGAQTVNSKAPATGATYGMNVVLLGAQDSAVTIAGQTFTLQANEAIIAMDITRQTSGGSALVGQPGDICVMFYPQHTDSLQVGAPAISAPNFDNITFQTYKAYGSGFGNMILFQPRSGNEETAGKITTDSTGAFSISGNVAPLFVGDAIFAFDNTNFPDQYCQTTIIRTLNADGVSGTLARPFVDTSGAAFGVASMTVKRTKSMCNVGIINSMFAVNNLAQFNGGCWNVHFLNCSVLAVAGDGTANGTVLSRGHAAVGFVLRDTILYTLNTTLAAYGSLQDAIEGTGYKLDPRPAYTAINCALSNTGSAKSGYFPVNDNGVSSVALPNMVIDSGSGSFRVKSGMPRTTVSSVIPFDAEGQPRVTGISLIGAVGTLAA